MPTIKYIEINSDIKYYMGVIIGVPIPHFPKCLKLCASPHLEHSQLDGIWNEFAFFHGNFHELPFAATIFPDNSYGVYSTHDNC